MDTLEPAGSEGGWEGWEVGGRIHLMHLFLSDGEFSGTFRDYFIQPFHLTVK